MAHHRDLEQHIVEVDALHARLGIVEAQLATARVQRLSGPASGLLFAGLSWLWFGDEIRAAAPGSSAFLWVALFGVSCLLGLVFNEVLTRRAGLRLEDERDRLVLALKSDGELGTRLPASNVVSRSPRGPA